jgi:hypothetical protein
MVTDVINIYHAPGGWRNDPQYVYIGRANKAYSVPKSKWHNPYSVSTVGSRQAAIDGFRQYIEGRPSLLADLHELRGKTLVCWCAPKACHGDVLKELVESRLYVAIIGSREYTKQRGASPQNIIRYVRSLPENAVVVSGGATGVDSIGVSAAEQRGLETVVFPAEWDKYGKSAGFRRNHDIVNAADIVIAFWDGKSRGTKHSMGLARKQNKPLYVNPAQYESPPEPKLKPTKANVFDVTTEASSGKPKPPPTRYEWRPATLDEQRRDAVAYRVEHTHIWHADGHWLPYTRELRYTEQMLRRRYSHYLIGCAHGDDVPGWWLAWDRTQAWIENFKYQTRNAA